MISYNEIYEAALTFQSEVVLSKKISPAALMQIMNIIYLDTPELFMLETIYEYDTESNGNVHKVYLKYNMTPEDYAAMNEVYMACSRGSDRPDIIVADDEQKIRKLVGVK